MNTNYPGFKEETILSPIKTRFEIECVLRETDYLLEPNRYNEYILKFEPLTSLDNQILTEHVMEAEASIMMQMSPYSSKVVKQKYESNGLSYVSQLWKPKVNLVLENTEMYINRPASLTLHLRDSVDGSIYLQCEWCDLYEQDTDQMFEDDENGDFDF
tara:strand:- start:186 stop:659 length:474 start_codon:yes stop_codon:yes gene_type:complete